jgi:NTP pyrophosphatase (non-canonical NTP hydrolase)
MTSSIGGYAVTLQEIRENVQRVHLAQGWVRRGPLERFAYLVAEVGELADELITFEVSSREIDVKTETDAKTKDLNRVSQVKAAIAEEMSDILWNLIDLGDLLAIDLDSAIRSKLALMEKRKWGEKE